MKFLYFKVGVLIALLVLCDFSHGKRMGGARSRSKAGSGSWWNRRKSSSNPSSDTSSSSGSHHQASKQEVAKTKPSAPVDYSSYNRKDVSNTQQQLSPNRQNSPSPGWKIPTNQQPINSNVGWKQPKPSQPASPNNPPIKSPWTSAGTNRRESPVKKETSKVQQSSPNQPQPPQPGWNVPGQNAHTHQQHGGYQTHGAPPPAYPHHNVAPPGYNGQTSWGAPPAYPGHAPNYGGFGHSNAQPGGYGGYGGYGGHSQPSFGGYNPGYGGGMAAGAMGMGMGNSFGGNRGFGGGGYGGGGYPMKKSFFSASTIGNVVAGMLIYNMASSLISHGLGLKRPYTVVNYYNQSPDNKVEEIKLPANVLTLCDGNATQLCGQGTQSVCTQNGTVLCVATMNQASPCDQGGNHALCINTTVPCADANDPLCQNSTKLDKLEADVNVPCFTNLTLDVNLVDRTQTVPNTKYTYCVTTMAIAGPEYRVCDDPAGSNDYRSVLDGNYEWYLENDGFRRNYSIYNFENPMETNGEINMPVTVLTKCSDKAKELCAPGVIPTCTTFNEVMCLVPVGETEECLETNTTCVKSNISCTDHKEGICEDVVEVITLDMPCFANITLNAPIPKFNLAEFNGTLPDLTVTSSYTYHFNYCVITLALPGTDFDLCVTKEAKEKQDKEQHKS